MKETPCTVPSRHRQASVAGVGGALSWFNQHTCLALLNIIVSARHYSILVGAEGGSWPQLSRQLSILGINWVNQKRNVNVQWG